MNYVVVPGAFSIKTEKEHAFSLPSWFSVSETERKDSLGVAVDLGTTTIAATLWDRKNCRLLATASATNPQCRYGADVITRIQFALEKKENLELLQKLTINALSEIIGSLADEGSIDVKEIEEAVVVGNTTMLHFLLALDPSTLAKAPFLPSYQGDCVFNARDYGFALSEKARVYLLPNIWGHVGADATAVLLATSLTHLEGTNIAVDIGTNGEILLATNEKLLVCSAAAGPAFEGASISQGMRAFSGAIKAVTIEEDGQIRLSVIGNLLPVGICGSGLIDSIAELLRVGILDKTGKLCSREEARAKGLPETLINQIEIGKQGIEFSLCEGVSISQKDIREFQLAKGAIVAAICILIKESNVSTEDIQHIFIAGAFGSDINKDNAVRIGLLPDVPRDKLLSVGNAAGIGASMALLSDKLRTETIQLTKSAKHIELSSHPAFEKLFLESMYLGVHTV